MAISPIPRGTTRTIRVTYTDDNGDPVDVSADTATLTVKINMSDADPGVLQEDADMTTAGANGQAIFVLTPALTDIDPGLYFYDIILYIASSGGETQSVRGTLTIADRVSDV